jgi:hypothetical protein
MGTRVKEVRTLFDRDVTVRCIYEPLKACLADADALEMAALLEERGFDVAAVKEPDNDSFFRRRPMVLKPLPAGTDAGVELQSRLGYKIDFTDSTSRRKLAQYADFHREYPQFVRVVL